MEKFYTTLVIELVALVKQYGSDAVMWILIVACFVGGIIDFLPKDYFNSNNGVIFLFLLILTRYGNHRKVIITSDDEKEGMTVRMSANNDVNNVLEKLKLETQAQRTFVMEYHNGRISLNGIPFLYIDMTYEKCVPGMTYVSGEYQNLNTSLYMFPCYMMEKGYFSGTMDELESIDPKIAHRMQDNGIGYSAIIMLKKNGNLIGLLGASYTGNIPTIDKEELHTKLSIYAQDVTDSLDTESFNKKKKKS